jgi:serine/threonine-protein kinase
MQNEALNSVRNAIQSESEVSEQPAELLAEQRPKMLGRYKILDEVGRGATAIVYRAYDPQLDRFIAVKVLKEQLSRNKRYRESFIREARLAAQLTHPNIVTVFDVESSDSKTYIAMELLEGTTLEAVLKKKAVLSVKSTLQIASQLAAALAYSHQNGVIHRDIKPGNILVLKDRKSIKLMDYGIALLDSQFSEQKDVENKVLGTPEYMSPEQLLGKKVDSRSDLYSMGVLIYRMLAGLPPFVSDDLGNLFRQIIKSRQPELNIDDELVADELKDLVRRLLQKRKSKRFQTAFQLQSELRSISNKLLKSKENKASHFKSLTSRWTITMAGSVFVAMSIGLLVVHIVQQRLLSNIIYEYGHSVGKMVAYQSSESIVLADKVGLDALVAENAANPQVVRITIRDTKGVVLAKYLREGVLLDEHQIKQTELLKEIDSTQIYNNKDLENTTLFDVIMPINYGDKRVGTLLLSYSANSINDAGKRTLITMLSVMLVTLLVVSVATLILASKTGKDYRRITAGLTRMAAGRTDVRIFNARNTEAQGVFSAFNQLAGFLEKLIDGSASKDRDTQSVQLPIVKTSSSDQRSVDTVELNLKEDN